MKKIPAILLCFSLACTVSGCALTDIVERLASTGDAPVQEDMTAAENHRVYMDEITGILQDFNGYQLTVKSGEESYVFDVSQATLECQEGMITGDEVSIIYEGQLSDTDTSAVKALKVVDEFHKKAHLKDRTAHGQVQGLTENTITIKSKSGKTATYPITGTEQYYQNGIAANAWVYLHFKGKFPENGSDSSMVLNASHLKVTSISDIDPLTVPAPTPTPPPESEAKAEKQFRAAIQGINLNILTVLPSGSQTPVTIDLTTLPCYFKGGAAPGSHVNVSYSGEFNGTTLQGINVTAVTGDDPDTMKNHQIGYTVSGTIMGSTSNTITLQSYDGAIVTCNINNAKNSSTGGLLTGASVKVTFSPSASKDSNIYTCLKIEDA